MKRVSDTFFHRPGSGARPRRPALVLAAAGCGATASAASPCPAATQIAARLAVGALRLRLLPHDLGIDGADGKIGPPLVDFADRRLIAGRLPNTLPNLLRWLEHPQQVAPGTVMPDLEIEEPQARDLAAYLYSH